VVADAFDDDRAYDEGLGSEDIVEPGPATGPATGRAESAEPVRVVRRPVQRRIDLDELSPAQRAALGRLQARKVGRVVRDVSPWSVFKFSLLFWVCVWLILMVAGVILWKVGQGAGVIDNVEKFYAKASGEKTFELDGRGVFRAGAALGAVLTVALTGLSVLIAALFNLVSDLTGGIRMSVVELESTRRPVRATGGLGASIGDATAVPPQSSAGPQDHEAAEPVHAAGRDGPGRRSVVEDDDATAATASAPPVVPTLVPDAMRDADSEASSFRSAAH
jgi:hypothetical protein